jgi:hypothetical protein
MYEKLFIALFSFVLGVLLFKYREWYSEGSKRKKVYKKLKAKILFWIIEDWGEKFEKIFIVGHALSMKYNPIGNISELESQRKLVDDEIESSISEVKNQFSESSISKDFIDSIPKLHEKRFDSVIEHFDNYLKKIDEDRFKEKPDIIFSWAFEYLQDIAPETVPIKVNDDWKEALYFAAFQHRNEKISGLLPTVHEEYLLKKEMGMLEISEGKDWQSGISEMYKKNILKGRELLGEPRDFDF